ncbi:hypothetical protein pb186bvf_020929 [Paramecium bursaria]
MQKLPFIDKRIQKLICLRMLLIEEQSITPIAYISLIKTRSSSSTNINSKPKLEELILFHQSINKYYNKIFRDYNFTKNNFSY